MQWVLPPDDARLRAAARRAAADRSQAGVVAGQIRHHVVPPRPQDPPPGKDRHARLIVLGAASLTHLSQLSYESVLPLVLCTPLVRTISSVTNT